MLRGKTYGGEQITPCQAPRAVATRTPAFEAEDVFSRAGFVRAGRNETHPLIARGFRASRRFASATTFARSNGRKLAATARQVPRGIQIQTSLAPQRYRASRPSRTLETL